MRCTHLFFLSWIGTDDALWVTVNEVHDRLMIYYLRTIRAEARTRARLGYNLAVFIYLYLDVRTSKESRRPCLLVWNVIPL